MFKLYIFQKLILKGILLAIWFYRYSISPYTKTSCRFLPSCSTYAFEAITIHGSLKGVWLTLKRIAKCHPWGKQGVDLVPPNTLRK